MRHQPQVLQRSRQRHGLTRAGRVLWVWLSRMDAPGESRRPDHGRRSVRRADSADIACCSYRSPWQNGCRPELANGHSADCHVDGREGAIAIVEDQRWGSLLGNGSGSCWAVHAEVGWAVIATCTKRRRFSDRIPAWSASSAPSGARVWTMSSCSTRPVCDECSRSCRHLADLDPLGDNSSRPRESAGAIAGRSASHAERPALTRRCLGRQRSLGGCVDGFRQSSPHVSCRDFGEPAEPEIALQGQAAPGAVRRRRPVFPVRLSGVAHAACGLRRPS